MASSTPAVEEVGCKAVFSGCATLVAKNPMPARPQGASVERLGPVRILRGAAWRGVALRLAPGGGEAERFEIALTAGDGRSISIALADQEDAVALWRDCGRTSGLPLLIETEDGAISEPYPQIGRVMVGPVRIRRRYAFLNGRRPRFLARRKTGRRAEHPVVIAGERLTD